MLGRCAQSHLRALALLKGHSQTHSYTQSEGYTETTHRAHIPVFQRFSRVVDKVLGEYGVSMRYICLAEPLRILRRCQFVWVLQVE